MKLYAMEYLIYVRYRMVIFLIVSFMKQNYTIINLRIFIVDISVYKHGFHSDLNETFLIGNVDQKSRHLVRTAYECLEKAMEMSKSLIKFLYIRTKISFTFLVQYVQVQNTVMLAMKFKNTPQLMVVPSYVHIVDMVFISK